jgi:hypothetical protein
MRLVAAREEHGVRAIDARGDTVDIGAAHAGREQYLFDVREPAECVELIRRLAAAGGAQDDDVARPLRSTGAQMRAHPTQRGFRHAALGSAAGEH